MKEMLLGLGGDYYYVTVNEKAIERLPQEYQKRDNFFKTVTLYEKECIDERVIALAKEMGTEFYNHSEREGFKIIGWDETKVIPVFMEVEYEEGWGEDKLRFISIEDADEWEIEHGYIKTYCHGKDLLMGNHHYNFVDYTPTEMVFNESDEDDFELEVEESNKVYTDGTSLAVCPYNFTLSHGNSWTSCHNIDKN